MLARAPQWRRRLQSLRESPVPRRRGHSGVAGAPEGDHGGATAADNRDVGTLKYGRRVRLGCRSSVGRDRVAKGLPTHAVATPCLNLNVNTSRAMSNIPYSCTIIVQLPPRVCTLACSSAPSVGARYTKRPFENTVPVVLLLLASSVPAAPSVGFATPAHDQALLVYVTTS